MRFRYLPPVHSPLSWGALAAGLRAAVSPRYAERAREEVEGWLKATYQPDAWVWTDSGTSALTLALRLASEEGRHPVALPAYGCYDLATACDGAQVRVHLYDLDPATLGPDWGSLEEALKAGARVVVVAYLYGVPIDLDRVEALAAQYGATVVEDAAQGVGASWRGRPLGAHGALSILSFGRGKGVTAGGGGVLMGRGSRWAGALPSLERGGRDLVGLVKSAAQFVLARPSLYAIPSTLPFLRLGETIYRPPHQAVAPAEASFGLLSRSVRTVAPEARARRRNAARIRQALGPGAEPGECTHASALPGYLRFPLLLSAGREADSAARRLGIMPGYPTTLQRLSGFGERRVEPGRSMPGADVLAARLVTIPTHGLLSEADLAAIERWARSRGMGD
jgi:perosamine synthetase